MVETLPSTATRLAAAAADELLAATDVADLLVKKGMPFREAHGVVAGLVRTSVETRRRAVAAVARARCRPPRPVLDEEFYAVLGERPVARVQGLRGRHLAPARRASSSQRPARRWSEPPRRAAVRLGCGRGARARRLDGAARRDGRPHRRDRGLPRLRARLPRLRRPHGAHARAVRPARRSPTCTAPTGSTRCSTPSSEPEGVGAAVLIRALEPHEGVDADARAARVWSAVEALCSGPGKLTQALGIGLELNGADLLTGPIRDRPPPAGAPAPAVVAGPRIGITKAADLPWRFSEAGSRFVSKPRPPRLDGRLHDRPASPLALVGRRFRRHRSRSRLSRPVEPSVPLPVPVSPLESVPLESVPSPLVSVGSPPCPGARVAGAADRSPVLSSSAVCRPRRRGPSPSRRSSRPWSDSESLAGLPSGRMRSGFLVSAGLRESRMSSVALHELAPRCARDSVPPATGPPPSSVSIGLRRSE